MDVKSKRGAECGTDHYLVLSRIRQRIKIEKRSINKVSEKICFDERKIAEFQVKIANRFAALEIEDTDEVNDETKLETLWQTFQSSIKETAKEVFPKKRTPKKPWFNDKCRDLVVKRKEAKDRFLKCQSTEAKERYHEISRKVNNTLRSEKRKFINDKLTKAEQDSVANNSKDFHNAVRFFQKGFCPKVLGVKDKEGKIVGDAKTILKTWKDYFRELLNSENVSYENDQEDPESRNDQETVEPTPTLEEIENVVKKLKNGKAAGEDGIPVELIKYGGRPMIKLLHNIIVKVWDLEIMPKEWKEAVIIPIYKKGDKLECSNYRGISLLNCTYKILSTVILNRLREYGEQAIGEHQAGFMSGKSTTDQIFVMKELASKYWEYNKDLYILFIDFKKAYDSLIRSKVWNRLRQSKISEKLIRLIRMCVEGSKGKVRIERELTDTFDISSGVRQGDGLSPLLFNLALEKALKTAAAVPRGANIEGKINILAYADDVALAAESKRDLEALAQVFLEEALEVGLHVNEDKTRYIKIGRVAEPINSTLDVMGYAFKSTEEFKYLGVTVNNQNKIEEEIQIRLNAANRCYWSLLKLLKSKHLSRDTKIRIYTVILQPVLLYGAEVWTLTKQTQKKLIIFENKILRRIYGPIFEEGIWRIRTNREIRNLYRRPDIVAVVRSRRIRWLGHVRRREENTAIRRVWRGQPEGRRPLGRPRLRWSDQVSDDVRRIGGEVDMAEDRGVWRQLVGEAKNHLGFEWPQE